MPGSFPHIVQSRAKQAQGQFQENLHFDFLLADVEAHFQALTLSPADVLHHIGSPFAPDKDAI